MKSIVYVGMDVHSETFSLCALDPNTGEILRETTCASDSKMVEKFIDGLAEITPEETTFLTGYEAGCLGFSLYKSLEQRGISCVILAPTTMFSSAKNAVIKNDRMDAVMIARNLASNTYQAVHVPDEEDENVRDYIRMRKSFKRSLTRVKQQLGALILRRGYHFGGTKQHWTKAHRDWIKRLEVPALVREILDEYMVQLEEYEVKIQRFDEAIEMMSHNDRYEVPVKKMTCLKGISTTVAMTVKVEISDFDRFPTAPAFMSYLGLTPSEHSSGKHTNKGAITKQGNSTVRTALVEASQSLVKGSIGYKATSLIKRQIGQPAAVISYADKGTRHLQRKFERLLKQGKKYNVAIAAIARDLAGFIWGLETGNIDY